jgi:hypothetical protein
MRLSIAALLLALCLVAVTGVVSTAFADAEIAAITLARDPEPPFCVANPGGVVDISWDIEHTTTPNRVEYRVE